MSAFRSINDFIAEIKEITESLEYELANGMNSSEECITEQGRNQICQIKSSLNAAKDGMVVFESDWDDTFWKKLTDADNSVKF